MMLAGRAGSVKVIPQAFSELMLRDPGLILAEAERLGVDMQQLRASGLGEKTVDLATQARLLNQLAQTNPRLVQQALAQAQQSILIESLK
jgi:hypothetical protein